METLGKIIYEIIKWAGIAFLTCGILLILVVFWRGVVVMASFMAVLALFYPAILQVEKWLGDE